jgi:hypothetical protein
LALAVMAVVLGGCVYDPYTGAYVPCCNYYGGGYPQGGYPQGGYPQQQGPYGAPPPGQPGVGRPPPPPGASAYPSSDSGLAQHFAAANLTHDGALTREEAAAGMSMMARNFDVIDVDHKGFVTMPEIRTSAAEQRAGQNSAGG